MKIHVMVEKYVLLENVNVLHQSHIKMKKENALNVMISHLFYHAKIVLVVK